MQWIGISGSWRATSPEVEKDVRDFVRKVVQRGDGIITGGALNVDYFATDEVLKYDKDAKQIQVFLPVTLERYAAHYRKRADEGVITHEQAEQLIAQLTELQRRNPRALIEHPENTVVDTKTYYERNTEVVNASDALAAFQVNESKGVQDTVQKAEAQGKEVFLKQYSVIDKIAWIEIQDRKVAYVRTKGKDLFYSPGGKRDGVETDEQALIREIKEELDVTLTPGTFTFLETFRAQAHGKPEGVLVQIQCYQAEFEGELKPASEIEELAWFTSKDMNRTSVTGQLILAWLKEHDLID